MDRKRFNVVIIVISCVLLALSEIGVANVLLHHSLDAVYLVGAIVLIFSLNFLLLYMILGFSKGHAKLYKLSVFLGALNALAVTIVSANERSQYLAILFCAICFGLYLLLAFLKDLGKIKSLIICVFIILFRLSGFISNVGSYGNILDDHVILIGAQLVLAIVVFVATFAKYVDKSERGTN